MRTVNPHSPGPIGPLGEQVPSLDAEGPRYFAEGPDRRLAPAVLDGVDGLCRDPGLPG